jgi:predicted aspartyl protease
MVLLRNWGVGLLGFVLAACGSQIGFAQETPDEQEMLAGEIRFEGGQVILNVENTGRHSLVTVNFGDSENYKLIIDTGSGSSLIDTELAEALGFEVVDQREVLSGGVDPIMLDVVRVPSIQVGEMEVRNAEILTAPLDRMTGGSALGVLGMNLFSDHLIAFNQRENQVIVSTGALNPDAPGTYAMVSEGQFVDITIDVAGTPVNMHIDTGARAGLHFRWRSQMSFH